MRGARFPAEQSSLRIVRRVSRGVFFKGTMQGGDASYVCALRNRLQQRGEFFRALAAPRRPKRPTRRGLSGVTELGVCKPRRRDRLRVKKIGISCRILCVGVVGTCG